MYNNKSELTLKLLICKSQDQAVICRPKE